MLDTNICIFAIRGARKNSKIYQNLYEKIKNQTDIAISSLVLAELMHGVELSESSEENRSALADFLCGIEVLPFTEDTAEEYGEIRADLQKRGQLIGVFDMLIAAHAKSQNAILVTNNIRDFERIQGLVLEDWKE
jgi:tRNA(fMet)-specific endonuclease VapC